MRYALRMTINRHNVGPFVFVYNIEKQGHIEFILDVKM